MKSLAIGTVVLSALLGAAPAFSAPVIASPFNSSYSIYSDITGVSGVPAPFGGLIFEQGNPNVLLLGGAANTGGGAIYAVTVTRDSHNQIVGLGPAALFSTAPGIDGGLLYGPGGDLFFTDYPSNQLGEIKPGSTSPDKMVNLSTLMPNSVCPSVGTLGIVQAGLPGSGDFKIGSYNCGTWYDATLTPDGSGTYNVSVTAALATTGSGPEGMVWLAAGNPGFTSTSALVSEYTAGRVSAYEVDSDGNPIPASRQNFITGLTGAEGAVIDPLTGDFLFSTFGGGNQVLVVSGFNAPTPEPASGMLFGAGLVVLSLISVSAGSKVGRASACGGLESARPTEVCRTSAYR